MYAAVVEKCRQMRSLPNKLASIKNTLQIAQYIQYVWILESVCILYPEWLVVLLGLARFWLANIPNV